MTSYLDSAARNFGLDTQIEHDERYKIAEEYMEVVYKVRYRLLRITISTLTSYESFGKEAGETML